MTPVPALEELIGDAARDGASALHLQLERDMVAAMARQGQALVPLETFRAPNAWLERARAHPQAAELADRIVIRTERRAAPMDVLARLGMAEGMREALERAFAPPGGVVLAISLSRDGCRRLAEALAHAAPGGYMPWISGRRETLEAASRMDCDAILLDGLADRGVATLAFDLARTGQRIVAAIDAIDAMAAIGALRALQVERHLLGAGLRALVAAHGARRLCAECRLPVQANASESALLGIDPGTVIYRPAGCGACDGTGYAGTALVFEAIAVDGALHGLLAKGADAALLARHAFAAAPTLAASARILARKGRITAQEAIRIARAVSAASGRSASHPHVLPSAADWLDGEPIPPLSARLRGDRSSVG